MGSIDMAVSAAGSSVEFSARRWKELAVPLAKVYALQAGILVLLVLVCAVLAFAVVGGMVAELLEAPWGLAMLLAAFIILGLPAGIVMGAVATVAYNIADSLWRNSPEVSIIGSARRMLVPFAIYTVVQFGAFSGLLVISVALGFLAFSVSPLAGAIGMALLVGMSLLVMVVIHFLFQFAPLEIALNGAGGLEAMKKSSSLVRKSLAATLVFDLILFGVSMAIGTVFGVATQVFSLGFAFAAIIPGSFIVVLALMMLVYLAQAIAIGIFIIPMTYRFWKSIGGMK